MRKIVLVIAILLTINTCYSSTLSPTLGKIENILYGFQYDTEDDTNRLDRIENSVYGKVSQGSAEQRIAKLRTDLSTDLMGQEITPKEDTFAEEEEVIELADAGIEYPAVDELEMIVFNQKFGNKDITERLSKLEQETFGQSFTDDLSSRVDRLKAELKPSGFMQNQIAQSANMFYDEDVMPLEKNYHLDRYESPNQFDYDAYNAARNGTKPVKKANITTVEKSVLNRSFKNDAIENRLARLESAMFGTQFTQDDNETRAQRIASAYRAQKSATKYDNNKFSQNMATAFQIGTILLMVLACIL